MKDKRKTIFCFICLIIIIVSEFFLYKKAYKEDQKYKSDMKNFLQPIATDIESRGFVKTNERDCNIENGCLSFERDSNNSNYGNLKIKYTLDGKIKNVSICLDYSLENYSDDIFSDVYYLLSLVGIDLYEDEYIDALNILIEKPSQKVEIDEEIKSSKIFINDTQYTLSLKKIKSNTGENKIQFCLE